jgi:GT2 family glycosyltransferase
MLQSELIYGRDKTLRNAIRKYLIVIIKLFVACFPLRVKKWFRQSPYLTSLYSRNLQKSGLSYGFPSRKKLNALYQSNIKHQDFVLKDSQSVKSKKHSFLVMVNKGNIEALTPTLESIFQHCQIEQVWVVCCPEDLSKCQSLFEGYSNTGVQLSVAVSASELNTLSGRGFLLFAGVLIHEKLPAIIDNIDSDSFDIVYCDTDKIANQKRVQPLFFPDWNPDLHLATGYVRTALWMKDIGQLKNVNYPSSQEFIASALAFLWSRNGSALNVFHSHLVLVHQTLEATFSYKKYAQYLLDILGGEIKVEHHSDDQKLSLAWPTTSQPLVSLVIPTKNGKELVKACIESILQKTHYQNYEILLVNNNSDDPAAIAYFKQLDEHPKIRLLDYSYEFNYSAINNFAVSQANGSVVGLVNNDIEVISPNWLCLMLGQVIRSEIGCVGAKLLYADSRVQHAGVVLGYGGGAGHAHKYFPRYHPGYLNRLGASGNYSAVTAACLLIKKEDYLAVNGLDEVAFKVAFNDVDFCLKILGLGKRNLYCAEAELYHHESVSRGFDDTHEKKIRFDSELALLKERWSDYIQYDPAYNSNLTLKRENFSIKDESER